ncbi:hypothetical protein [Flammeovirga kamogawensis]|uniref:hypothetical protein n=1 Tax=Flammeovirga kamogawensis TaxID=373891 RepID=UPI001614DAAE|nr:hypothetical protein [Flammeovirga kamogawensis]MBB6464092.1 hypothetical protein [Flammeovirga kamogawensis]
MQIVSVDYYEIAYDKINPTPNYKTHYSEIDSIDFSIVLHMTNDKVEIFWDGEFYQFGIGLRINEKSVFDGYQSWNVSDSNLWSNITGQKIVDLEIAWELVKTEEQKTGKKEEYIYPQDLTLIFSNGQKVFISAAGFLNQNDPEVYGLLDNLTVTTNEDLARKVKMIS